MDRRAQQARATAPRHPPPQPGPDPHPRPTPPPRGGASLIVGRAFVLTVGPFSPELNAWLDALPDGRDREAITDETRFLAWWGLALYLFQLGSRRQLDYDLDGRGTRVLDNLNRLAGTRHTPRPVHDTLDYFLERVPTSAFAGLRTSLVRRLLRRKALDAARLLGRPVVLLDGSGLLCFQRRHGPHCRVQKHAKTTVPLHNVLEAKLLGPARVVVSVASELIENADAAGGRGEGADPVKQDGPLKAFDRLAPQRKAALPLTRLVLGGDSILACGRVLQACRDQRWSYVLTFEEGHLPAVWADFQGLLPLSPENVLQRVLADGTRQVHRWARGLSCTDEEGRTWQLGALECVETAPEGTATRFAWLTDLPVTRGTVVEIATKGGRYRWKIDNEGFNRPKNSGRNLCHV